MNKPVSPQKISAVNIALSVLTLAIGWCFLFSQFWGWDPTVRVLLKSAAGIMFVLLCVWSLFAYRRNNGRLTANQWCMLAGQILACLGDIVIQFSFIEGAVLFAAGHVMFFISFCLLGKFQLIDLFSIAGCCSVSVALLFFMPNLELGGLAPVIYGYAVIISCMLGRATALLFDKSILSRHRILIFTGALMFYLSDLMLLVCMFASGGAIFDVLCLLLYFPAECLLALSAQYTVKGISKR